MEILLGIMVAIVFGGLWFADTPAGEGRANGAPASGANNEDGGGAATGGGEATGAPETKPSDQPASGQPAGATEQLTQYQQALRNLDPDTAKWVYETAEKKSQEAAAAESEPDTTQPGGASGKEPPKEEDRLAAAEQRIKELEGKEQTKQRQAQLQGWITGIAAGIGKHEMAKELDEPQREVLTKLAMGYGALARELDSNQAVALFMKEAEPVINKLADSRAEEKLAKWKREFVEGKVFAAKTTVGEGEGAAPPERGEPKHEATDLDSGRTKERALRRAKMRTAAG